MILLDTHVVIWLFGNPEKLSPIARRRIRRSQIDGESMVISCLTLYEIARSLARGRMSVDIPVSTFLAKIEAQFAIEQLTSRIAQIAAGFDPTFPGDPFDRVIAATAVAGSMPLITADEHLRRCAGLETIW